MSDNTFRVWIGCLACYNNGTLLGDWHDASNADQVTRQSLHAAHGVTTDVEGYVLGEEIYGPHEELWCMDIENAPNGFDHEISPHEAQQIADALEVVADALDAQVVPAYFEWVAREFYPNSAARLAEHVDEFSDKLLGVYDSFRDFADQQADQWMESLAVLRGDLDCRDARGRSGDRVPDPVLRLRGARAQPGAFRLRHVRRRWRCRGDAAMSAAARDLVLAAGCTFDWSDDWGVGSHVAEYPDAYDEEPSECLRCILKDADGNVLDSLGCIDDPDAAYMRLVEVDLAYEALHDVNRVSFRDESLLSVEAVIAA